MVPQVAEPKLTLPLARTVSEETNFRAFPPKVCIAASIVMYAVTCKACSRGDTRFSHRLVAEYKIQLSHCVMSVQPPQGG